MLFCQVNLFICLRCLLVSTGLGRSPGEGKGYPVQYSSLENSVDGRVHGEFHGGQESDTAERLSLSLFTFTVISRPPYTYEVTQAAALTGMAGYTIKPELPKVGM